MASLTRPTQTIPVNGRMGFQMVKELWSTRSLNRPQRSLFPTASFHTTKVLLAIAYSLIFKGDWKDGMKHGHGTMTYLSGNIYQGEWKDNLKHGQGEMLWKNRNESFNGEWKFGKPNGSGIYIWKVQAVKYHQLPMFNFYQGEFLNGKRHGKGTFYYAR